MVAVGDELTEMYFSSTLGQPEHSSQSRPESLVLYLLGTASKGDIDRTILIMICLDLGFLFSYLREGLIRRTVRKDTNVKVNPGLSVTFDFIHQIRDECPCSIEPGRPHCTDGSQLCGQPRELATNAVQCVLTEADFREVVGTTK